MRTLCYKTTNNQFSIKLGVFNGELKTGHKMKNQNKKQPKKQMFVKKPYMIHDPYVWTMAINRTFPEKEVFSDGDRWNNVGEDYKELCESLYGEGYRISEEQINGKKINIGGVTMEMPIRTVYVLKK